MAVVVAVSSRRIVAEAMNYMQCESALKQE